MKKLLLTILAVVCLVAGASAQRLAGGSLTAAAASCTSSGPSCVIMTFDPSSNDAGAIGIDISSIPNATAVFEASFDGKAIDDATKTWRSVSVTPVASTTTVTSTTSAGAWRVAVSGMTDFRVRCSVFVAGPVVLTIRSSQKAASLGGGGGASFTSGGTSANVLPKATGSNQGLADSSITDDGTTVSTAENVTISGTGVLSIASNGTAAAPFLINAGQGTNYGMFFDPTFGLTIDNAGTGSLSIGSSNVNLRSSGYVGWTAGNSNASADTFLLRAGAANLQLGFVAAAAPVAQTLSVQSATATNTDQAGATWTLLGSAGTGLGAPGRQITKLPAYLTSSGTTVQTNVTRQIINGKVALTSGAAATVLSIPLATLQMAGGRIDYHIETSDGTNQCTSDNSVIYAMENSAGVFKVTVTKVLTTSVTNCTGAATLTETWAATSANPALIQVTATTSITSAANKFNIIYEVHHFGQTDPT